MRNGIRAFRWLGKSSNFFIYHDLVDMLLPTRLKNIMATTQKANGVWRMKATIYHTSNRSFPVIWFALAKIPRLLLFPQATVESPKIKNPGTSEWWRASLFSVTIEDAFPVELACVLSGVGWSKGSVLFSSWGSNSWPGSCSCGFLYSCDKGICVRCRDLEEVPNCRLPWRSDELVQL